MSRRCLPWVYWRVPGAGVEPATYRSSGERSTNWATRAFFRLSILTGQNIHREIADRTQQLAVSAPQFVEDGLEVVEDSHCGTDNQKPLQTAQKPRPALMTENLFQYQIVFFGYFQILFDQDFQFRIHVFYFSTKRDKDNFLC